MIKKIKIILFLLFISLNAKAENNFPSYGSKTSETKVVVKVFSSLTCPYCAEFHNKHLPKLIDKYVSSQKIMIELLDYPLDLAGLKAAQIQKCLPSETQKKYLDEIYLTQSSWSSAKTLKELETNLENIIKEFGISDKNFKNCLLNKKNEDAVLQSRINAQSKYNINSTPSFIINEKKFNGSFDQLDKYIEKLL